MLPEQPCCSSASSSSSSQWFSFNLRRTRGGRRLPPLAASSHRLLKPTLEQGEAWKQVGQGFEFSNAAQSGTQETSPSVCTGRAQASFPASASPQQRRRLRVAVDVDEVLGRFVHSLNLFCMDEYGLEYAVSDYHVYDFAKVWRCSQDESNHKVHEFFKSYHFAAGIEVIPGALESLRRLQCECDLMVVTSRQHVIREPTLEWIEAHFPNVFGAVHFGNHFALEGASRPKSEICRSIGADVLIDDNPHYALECAAAGIHVVLYDWDHGYPWSKTPCGPTHERITRARDWREVEKVLGVLAEAKGAET